MYTQFFGNYLLSNGYITQEQLFSAIQKQSNTRMKLGTLAIHAGYMTAQEVDQVVIEQTHQDKKFGELAIQFGYLTSDQVIELLKEQSPDFLLLGQILVEDGILSNTKLEEIMIDYRSKNEMIDLDMTIETQEGLSRLFDNFFIISETPVSDYERMYIELLFNNFIRFIGDDFTPLSVEVCSVFPTAHCAAQKVNGSRSFSTYINMDTETSIEFASRYVGEQFPAFDEYVEASLEDFLNLHNGLYIVNLSNDFSEDYTLSAPESNSDGILEFTQTAYQFSVMYSFGLIHFIIAFHEGI